jgi:hypothetical protein
MLNYFSIKYRELAQSIRSASRAIILLFIPAESSTAINLTGTWQWGWHKIFQNDEKMYSAGGALRVIQYIVHVDFFLSLTAGPPGHNMGISGGQFVLHLSRGVYRNIKDRSIIYFHSIKKTNIG